MYSTIDPLDIEDLCAAWRADWTAGNKSEMSVATITMTMINSTIVNARGRAGMRVPPQKEKKGVRRDAQAAPKCILRARGSGKGRSRADFGRRDRGAA